MFPVRVGRQTFRPGVFIVVIVEARFIAAASRGIDGASRTGAPVNFIDAETEAYCDYIANRDYGKGAVLMDIGGASIEICDLGKDGADHRRCLRFGVQDLHSKFVEHIQPNEEEGKKILKYIRKKFDAERVPDRGFGTVVLAGATNLALYAVYAEYTGNKQQGERAMRYKKFKKLAEHLLGGTGRSRLILDAAPEKLHSVGIAALLVKAFVRRVGAENIVVSERGVKDGYLRLVVDGALQGAAVRLTGAEMPQAAKENERARGSEGRADAAEKQGQPPATAPKRRGRPPKTAKGSEGETGAKAKKAEGAPKRRGRPPKAAQDIGTEGVKK